MSEERRGFWRRIGPALTLAVVAPMVAEVLPGATRFSSIFVLPIEICVWGLGAVIARECVRRWVLGWRGLVCLGLALAMAEEFVIQQTSVAPMVIQLKGVTYARAFGINYVYLLWALIYETVFVVLVPVAVAEMVFVERRKERWLSRGGWVVAGGLFLIGASLAWFSWTRIARVKVFHVAAYTPPVVTTLMACLVIAGLIGVARRFKVGVGGSLIAPWVLCLGGFVWAVLLYGVVLLGFGIAPWFPVGVAVAVAVMLAVVPLVVLSRFEGASQAQSYWLVFGMITGAMLAGFIGFIGATKADLVFKIVVDVIAFALLVGLQRRVASRVEGLRAS
jgi:hypothetical protein